jgi:3-oxosteroid 1-dehydrogenase
MRQAYQQHPTGTEWTNVAPGDTGEMIEMLLRHGAQVATMDQSWWTPVTVLPSGAHPIIQTDISRPHSIVVDQSGQRYMCEAGSYVKIGMEMYRRNETTPSVPSWVILDGRHRAQYMWAGATPGHTPPEWISSGYMKVAPTLRELAQQCEIDPDRLVATVERFNAFARSGNDEDFNRGKGAMHRFAGDPRAKPNPSLGVIDQGPFYAAKMYPGDVGTSGGIVTDQYARVLGEDGGPITGLYAVGNTAASVMGRSYPGAGAAIGGGAVFGYIAAKHALAGNVSVERSAA